MMGFENVVCKTANVLLITIYSSIFFFTRPIFENVTAPRLNIKICNKLETSNKLCALPNKSVCKLALKMKTWSLYERKGVIYTD